ncbi:substrate-binding domain-containing protein [Algibacter sp. PT7-4]|uniref:substrate-binding domain-containing protein n=1 Tax=Algibacter ulvanivorans TaxID=3400999 RepID=UPI003AAD0346
MEINKLLKIDNKSRVPNYQQIVNSITHNVSIGNLKANQKILSINRLSLELSLPRETIEKAYNILKDRNIINFISSNGFYVSKNNINKNLKILFLINKLSWYKMEIYNSFLTNIGTHTNTELYIYHCNETLFLNHLKKQKKNYDYYIVMPHFKTKESEHCNTTNAITYALNKIPKDKLVIIDNIKASIQNNIITVYEDYEKDIYNALSLGINKIKKHKKIILVYPNKGVSPYPKSIKKGFIKFCSEHKLDYDIFDKIYDDMVLLKGDLFITIDEDDLINLMEQISENELVLGKEIGVISYNDTPLKALLGITVITTDFKKMGAKTAQMILNNEKGKYKVPFYFIDRDSI